MINKRKILKALKADYTAAKPFHDDQMAKIAKWVDEYDGKPYGNEQPGKSRVVTRDIKKQSEWQHASIIDPFVSSDDIIKAMPVTYEDGPGARQAEVLLNTQFCRQFPRYNFMSKAVKVLDREGTCIIQTGWEYRDEEVEVEAPIIGIDPTTGQEAIIGTEMVTETRVLLNRPTAKVCRNEDIYIDPTCQDDMSNCQFVIYRYETDLSTLRQDGRYKNLDKINIQDADVSTDVDYDSEDDTEFKFEDDPRKKIIVYEYWGNYDIQGDGIAKPIVCAWVNDTIIRLQDNPYPNGELPFLVVPFNAVPFQLHGESNAELISDNQKIKTAITRGIIDNMAQSNNGQKGIKKGALDVANRRKFLSGQNFEFNTSANDFYDGHYNQIPGSAFNMLDMMNNEIESITGVKGFSGGINTSAIGNGSATSAHGVLDATSVRRLNTVRNIAENLVKPLMRKWLAYDAVFLDEKEVVRITNEEFVDINRGDLGGAIDISIHVSTAEDNSAKAQELSFMLQTGQQTMDPVEVRMIRSEIARLQKMPELARRIMEYQPQPPQPDPMQVKLQQVQLENAMLENAKLKAEVGKLYSMAEENYVDVRKKTAEAVLKEQQARKVASEADKIDLDFLEKQSGRDHEKELEKKNFDRLSNLDQMAFQAMHGDKNLGVARD